jgi:hypothetical protein
MYIHEIGSTAALPYGAAETAPLTAGRPRRAVPWQERHQVLDHADRADARAAAAVRDAEGLVQVQVRDVAAELARRGQADQRVHVGAVHIDAAAMRLDHRADLPTWVSNTP